MLYHIIYNTYTPLHTTTTTTGTVTHKTLEINIFQFLNMIVSNSIGGLDYAKVTGELEKKGANKGKCGVLVCSVV